MDTAEGLIIIAMIIGAVALCTALVFCFWWFSGYLCTTFKWYDIDRNAQIITTIVLLTIGSASVRK